MSDEQRSERQELTKLRFVTYNTNRYGLSPERLRLVFDRIEAMNGDAYGLEEYVSDNVPALQERFGDRYTIVTGELYEDVNHQVIMVRNATLEVVPGTCFCLNHGLNPGLPGKHPDAISVRMSQLAMLQRRGGSPGTRVGFCVTQLDNISPEARKVGNRQVLDYRAMNWGGSPMVYVGDFNANTWGYASSRRLQKPLLDVEDAGFYNAWTYTNKTLPPPQTFFGVRDIKVEGMPDQDRYTYNPDHVFFSEGIHCTKCAVDSEGKGASDHIGMYADLVMLDWR